MSTETHFYQAHVFVCQNERPSGHERGCCNSKGATKLRNYMKIRAKELGLPMTRINTAGCLDRCELGPVMVIYPEGTWYRYDTMEDVDAILNDHLVGGRWLSVCSLGWISRVGPTGKPGAFAWSASLNRDSRLVGITGKA